MFDYDERTTLFGLEKVANAPPAVDQNGEKVPDSSLLYQTCHAKRIFRLGRQVRPALLNDQEALFYGPARMSLGTYRMETPGSDAKNLSYLDGPVHYRFLITGGFPGRFITWRGLVMRALRRTA